jgi:hypothetical protein
MKNLIVKILVRLVNLNLSESYGVVDKQKLDKWLYVSYKDEGWKQYYTLRKKSLLQLLSLGVENNSEYWKTVGRMQELNALSTNINAEIKRRKKVIKAEKSK